MEVHFHTKLFFLFDGIVDMIKEKFTLDIVVSEHRKKVQYFGTLISPRRLNFLQN